MAQTVTRNDEDNRFVEGYHAAIEQIAHMLNLSHPRDRVPAIDSENAQELTSWDSMSGTSNDSTSENEPQKCDWTAFEDENLPCLVWELYDMRPDTWAAQASHVERDRVLVDEYFKIWDPTSTEVITLPSSVQSMTSKWLSEKICVDQRVSPVSSINSSLLSLALCEKDVIMTSQAGYSVFFDRDNVMITNHHARARLARVLYSLRHVLRQLRLSSRWSSQWRIKRRSLHRSEYCDQGVIYFPHKSWTLPV
jgi:hypothetical protein